MKVLDLFSGIGGFSLGLERAGMETIAFCEIDTHCRKVLKKHWPNIPIFDDVTKLSSKDIPNKVDLICGGFPCQDISIAGQKRGLEGKRSGLWFEYRRLIDEIRPRYVIIENVANLRNIGLTRVLKDLREIGYDAEWHIISACSVGLLHQRERIWIITYPSSKRQHECIGKGRHLQTNENGKDSEIYSERSKCESESRSFRPILSKRAFEHIRDTLPNTRTIVSKIHRVTDGVPQGLDERRRKERIKQLGNAVVPQIPQLIGEAILERERDE